MGTTIDDLDPAIWNLHTARQLGGLVLAQQHGYGDPAALEQCGCDTCTQALRPAPRQHSRGIAVDDVRAHILELLAAGMTRTTIAVHARLDRTTIGRALRPDVTHVEPWTAQRILGVTAPE